MRICGVYFGRRYRFIPGESHFVQHLADYEQKRFVGTITRVDNGAWWAQIPNGRSAVLGSPEAAQAWLQSMN